MPTPYELREPGEPLAARPRMVRPRRGRRLAGVCAGIAEHLGVPVRWVRIAMVVLTLAGGAGLLGYVFLWGLTPQEDGVVEAVPAGSARVVRHPAAPAPADQGPGAGPDLEIRGMPLLVLGAVVAGIGLLLAAQAFGLDLRSGIVIPLLVVGAGAVIAWSQLDETQRSRWLGVDGGVRGPGVARLAFGLLLAVVGLIVLATRGRSFSAVWDVGLATLAVLLGAGLIAAPWVVRLWTDLRTEQMAAARATERADIAAHLHDSVLQTLALIQRRADDPQSVTQLARAQERELRSWLYAGPVGSQATLAAAVTEVAHEVEDLQGTPVDLVVTGDRPLEDHGQALVRALREALLNAVRHGRAPVTAYVEVGPSGVEAFVRDHGDGFDPEDVPGDRLGVRESIFGRMERHGGTARVRRLEQGTEVELTLPPIEGEEP